MTLAGLDPVIQHALPQPARQTCNYAREAFGVRPQPTGACPFSGELAGSPLLIIALLN